MRFEIGEIGPRIARPSFAQLLAIAIVSLAALCLTAAPSQALIQRGYVLDKGLTIGSPGTGAGQMESPSGVAVNQATGNIYVVDSGNNRIDEFSPTGTFIRAWAGASRTAAKNSRNAPPQTTCQAGLAGHGKGELHSAGAIAIDNYPSSPSFGDVYVEAVKPYEEEKHEFEYGVIAKFNAEGKYITQLLGYKAKAKASKNGKNRTGSPSARSVNCGSTTKKKSSSSRTKKKTSSLEASNQNSATSTANPGKASRSARKATCTSATAKKAPNRHRR